MIGDIIHKRADIIVAGLTVTQGRSLVIDFTLPYYSDQLQFFIR